MTAVLPALPVLPAMPVLPALHIGRRYRRQDEIGTPFCVTVDFDTLDDHAVTVRERDSMAQERVSLDQVQAYLATRLLGC